MWQGDKPGECRDTAASPDFMSQACTIRALGAIHHSAEFFDLPMGGTRLLLSEDIWSPAPVRTYAGTEDLLIRPLAFTNGPTLVFLVSGQ